MLHLQIKTLKGHYKIKQNIIERIMKSELTQKGIILPGISDLELQTYIHFTHICDTTGYINEFKVSTLTKILHCSRKSTYLIIDGLVKKGFISVTAADHWTGIKDIQLLDNDFSKANYKNKNYKYLNTNYSFLHYQSPDYSAFTLLTLNQKKTLLYILYNYNNEYGYRSTIASLKEKLGIARSGRVVSYLHALQDVFGKDSFTIYPNRDKRLRYHIYYVTNRNPLLNAEHEVASEYDTYYKRQMLLFIKDNHVDCGSIKSFTTEPGQIRLTSKSTVLEHISELFGICKYFAEQHLSLDVILKTVQETLFSERRLDELSIKHIRNQLSTICST